MRFGVIRSLENKTTIGSIEPGEVFEREGDFYIKTEGVAGAVNLRTGCSVNFYNGESLIVRKDIILMSN